MLTAEQSRLPGFFLLRGTHNRRQRFFHFLEVGGLHDQILLLRQKQNFALRIHQNRLQVIGYRLQEELPDASFLFPVPCNL